MSTDADSWRVLKLIPALGAMGRLAAPAAHISFIPPGIVVPENTEDMTGLLLSFISSAMEAPVP